MNAQTQVKCIDNQIECTCGNTAEVDGFEVLASENDNWQCHRCDCVFDSETLKIVTKG